MFLARAFARVDPVALGVAVGTLVGSGIALATAALLLRGGPLVGLHLQRLAFYLPGYSVSWGGALVGLLEGAALGCGVGALMAWIWNGYHRMFVALVVAREGARQMRRELQGL